jgi:hypothetical protein
MEQVFFFLFIFFSSFFVCLFFAKVSGSREGLLKGDTADSSHVTLTQCNSQSAQEKRIESVKNR